MNSGYLNTSELANIGLRRCGKNVMIHALAIIVDPIKVLIGDYVRIDPFTVISAETVLGSHIHIGPHCSLSGGGRITMGDFSMLSHGCRLFTSSDDYSGESLVNPMVPENYRKVTVGDIYVNDHVAIGANSVIMPGLSLGVGSAIAALSFVSKNIPEFEIHGGVPAKLIKKRSNRCLQLQRELADGRDRA